MSRRGVYTAVVLVLSLLAVPAIAQAQPFIRVPCRARRRRRSPSGASTGLLPRMYI